MSMYHPYLSVWEDRSSYREIDQSYNYYVKGKHKWKYVGRITSTDTLAGMQEAWKRYFSKKKYTEE